MKRLAIIDGKSIFYRGYYAMPSLSTADGTPTGGVYGFASLSIELIKKLEPDYVAVAWDKAKTNIRRRQQIYPEYKAGRKTAPPDFYDQIPILRELLDAFGWPFYELDDYEADDIMGAFAKQSAEKGIQACLLTSDLDALQMVGPLAKVYAIKNGLSRIEEFDIEHFEQKYGIHVEQFLDLKSLKGDSSDNLPGVPGIGEKTAVELLQTYDTLDNIYAHLDDIRPSVASKLKAGRELAYMTKELASIWTDAPVQLDWAVADVNDIDLQKVAEILKRLEFNSLLKRLPKNMQPKPDQPSLFYEEPPSTITDFEETAWPETIGSDQEVILHIESDELWLQFDSSMARAKLSSISADFWRQIEDSTVVVYDGKSLYHTLADHGVEVHFKNLFDIAQAAFLINPLRRDYSLAGLLGETVSESKKYIAGLRKVYDNQKLTLSKIPRVAEVAEKLDFPLVYCLFMMERQGVKIDPAKLKVMSQELGSEHARLEQEMYTVAGYEFNIASPAQLSQVLFTKLQLPTAGIKRGKTGYSTGQKELDKLRGQHPIIELIEQVRELAKMKNTYIDTLPLLADSGDRVHTTFNQNVTATGRLSSTNPNLQNIPIRSTIGRKIRTAFIPEDGNLFVSADYSQFELRLAAVLSDDKKLIQDFASQIDIHTKTASEVYGVPIDEVTKNQRRAAKVINFGVLYGMSPHGLSIATGMDHAQAKQFIDQYFELRAPIRKYLDETLQKAKVDGYVETYYGRRRPTPDINSGNAMVRQAAERAAANMPIQGTEADLMKRAMLRVDENLGDLGKQILQVHDSILVECPADNAEKVAGILSDVMESIAPELPVKLKVDVSIGHNWGEL